MRPSPKARAIESLDLPFAVPVPLEFHRSPTARRISLRLDVAAGKAVLVAPYQVSRRQAVDFLQRHRGWLAAKAAQMPARHAFADGVTIPVLGIPHQVRGNPSRLRGLVQRQGGVVEVPGASEHLPRRLTDYLKKEAKREIVARAQIKAAKLGRPIAAVTLRDQRSRWGSCTASGRLAFSWRLVMAPEWVLDYVVAHEVAHLAELNHGPKFWRICAELTEADPKVARAWLKQNGAGLHLLG
jgi:predicted metal-dependent hydrolase